MLSAKAEKPLGMINASLGGVGSAVSACIADNFVINRLPNLCLVESSLADSGGATPLDLIGPSTEGILRKLINNGIYPVLLHLPRGDILTEKIQEIRTQTNHIAEYYQVPVIELDTHPIEGWTKDGIHTTTIGAQLYAEKIYEKLIMTSFPIRYPKRIAISERHLEFAGVTHFDLMRVADSLPAERVGTFRGLATYLILKIGEAIEISKAQYDFLGLLFIADERSAVVEFSSSGWKYSVQTNDQWSAKPRLQGLMAKSDLDYADKIRISITDNATGDFDCQGRKSTIVHSGDELKLIAILERNNSSKGFNWGRGYV